MSEDYKIRRSQELITCRDALHATFWINLIIVNIFGNILFNWLDSGFFFWVLVILQILLNVFVAFMIFGLSQDYKNLSIKEGHSYKLATGYKIAISVLLLLGLGNLFNLLNS